MKIPSLICAFVVFAVVGCATASAQGVRIVRASWGVQGRGSDVTGRLQAMVDRGQFSFPVTTRFFGFDPAPGRSKGVFVVYRANSRQFTQEASEGSTFTFRNIGGGPVPPPSGRPGEMRFVSQSRAPVRVYLINPWGRWEFVSNLSPGARFSTPARPGQRFVVTDSFNRIVRDATARPGGETIVIR
jgi:hypothetical protein